MAIQLFAILKARAAAYKSRSVIKGVISLIMLAACYSNWAGYLDTIALSASKVLR